MDILRRGITIIDLLNKYYTPSLEEIFEYVRASAFRQFCLEIKICQKVGIYNSEEFYFTVMVGVGVHG